MSISKDYFLLYHGISKQSDNNISLINDFEDFYYICALVLCVKRNNYNKFLNLNSFKSLCERITKNKIINIDLVYELQYSILINIQNEKSAKIDDLIQSFIFLNKEDILNDSDKEKLLSLFEVKNNKSDDVIICTKTYKDSILSINESIKNLHKIINTNNYKNELNNIEQYIINQEFSIGVTGVMNSGKSSMLNAIMNKEILGTSMIPETANLTFIKYGKTSAKISYWNKKQYNEIVNSKNNISSMETFVNDIKNNFNKDIDKYIQERSLVQNIDINELSKYTSANTNNKICNLIKYVNLQYDLEFLKHGVTIVDTPGLDDPVIQRENITKQYTSKCDVLFHLMNVSQSATLKDIEFIIDCILYQNITKLLIVITRADMVNKEQLSEVINYTKSSIKQQLEILNKHHKLDYILNSIEFISISAKMALLINNNKEDEAKKLGFTIEDTGIPKIKRYIHDTLYGKNSNKSQLILSKSKLSLNKLINKQIEDFNYEIQLLNLSKEDLHIKQKEFLHNKQRNIQNIQNIQDDIDIYKNELNLYLNNLTIYINEQINELQNILIKRVYSEVNYSYEKSNKKSNMLLVKNIINTAIKDKTVDIIRNYKYKLQKKTQYYKENCNNKYKNLDFEIYENNTQNINNTYINTNIDVLIIKISNELKIVKKSTLNTFFENISKHFKDELLKIHKDLSFTLNNNSLELINIFFIDLSTPLEEYKLKLNKNEDVLNNIINIHIKSDINKNEQSINIFNKIKNLEQISKGLDL